jgi:hypothetical protein
MNRKARDYGIERAKRLRQRLIEIVSDHANRSIAAEPFAQFAKHRVRKIHRNRFGFRSRQLDQAQQPPAAASQVQNARDALGQTLEEFGLAFCPVRNAVGAGEVFEGVRRRAPQIDCLITHDEIA